MAREYPLVMGLRNVQQAEALHERIRVKAGQTKTTLKEAGAIATTTSRELHNTLATAGHIGAETRFVKGGLRRMAALQRRQDKIHSEDVERAVSMDQLGRVRKGKDIVGKFVALSNGISGLNGFAELAVGAAGPAGAVVGILMTALAQGLKVLEERQQERFREIEAGLQLVALRAERSDPRVAFDKDPVFRQRAAQEAGRAARREEAWRAYHGHHHRGSFLDRA